MNGARALPRVNMMIVLREQQFSPNESLFKKGVPGTPFERTLADLI